MSRFAHLSLVGATLLPLGCGPIKEFRDSVGPPRPGRMLPNGRIKWDFWGNRYVEPYTNRPPRENPQPEDDLTAKDRTNPTVDSD